MQIKQLKRQQMLQAAKKLFTEHGFERTSMQKIADEANVGVATLFRYFPKKEMLICELVVELVEQMVPYFEEITHSNKTGYEKMEAILDAYINYLFLANREAVTIIENFEYYATYNPIDGTLIHAIREKYNQVGICISLAIQQGYEDGSIILSKKEQLTAYTIMNLFGIAMKKHAFTSFMANNVFPTPTKQELLDVKAVILDYLKA